MNKALLLALALIVVGCADAEQIEPEGDDEVLEQNPLQNMYSKELRFMAERLREELQKASSDPSSIRMEDISPQERSLIAKRMAELTVAYSSCYMATFETSLEDVRACAEWEIPKAQMILGLRYQVGLGVPADDVEALRLYRLAAEQGDAYAQSFLGIMYLSGEGVPQNDVLAYMWYNLAAAQGNEVAQGHKYIVEERMTSEQIAEAQRLSREWLEAHPSSN